LILLGDQRLSYAGKTPIAWGIKIPQQYVKLIDAAKASGIGALELWCFQANERARGFYEARGFRAIRFTDGADNEKRTPDILYRWELPAMTRSEDIEKRGSGSLKAT
jgi:hypothetical protein